MPTWETTADWDAAQDATGTHSEQPTGTEWAAASKVEKGWPGSDWADWSVPKPTMYFPCEETSGTTVNDVTGNGHDLTYSGPTLDAVTGPWDNTIPHYDGTDDEAVGTPTVSFGTSTSISVVAVVRIAAYSLASGADFSNPICAHETTGTTSDDGWVFALDNDGAPGIYTAGDNTWGDVVSAVDDDAIHLVGFTWDQANGDVFVYIDGAQDYSVTNYSDTSSVSSGDDVSIGSDVNESRWFGEGGANDAIGHFAYWIGTELTSTQHSELWNAMV